MKKRVCLAVLSILMMIATVDAEVTWRDVYREWLKTSDSYADVNRDGIVNLIDYDLIIINNYEADMADETFYVDPAKADDTGDGLTPSTAKKTVGAAIALCTAVGSDVATINLIDGTYDDSTQSGAPFGNRWTFFAGEANHNIVIQADPSNVSDTVFIDMTDSTSTTSYGVTIAASAGAANITLRDFVFDVAGGGTGRTRFVAVNGTGSHLILDNVSCPDTELNQTIHITDGARCEIIGCTLANATHPETVRCDSDMSDGLYIDNSVITNTSSTAGSFAVSADETKTIANLSIINGSILSGKDGGLKDERAFPNVHLEKSEFYSTGTATKPTVWLGIEYDSVDVDDWHATGDAYVLEEIVQNKGFIYECHQAYDPDLVANTEPGVGSAWQLYWQLYDRISAVIINCDFETQAVSDPGHSFLAAYGATAFLNNCRASGGNVQFVLKGKNCVIQNSQATGLAACTVYGDNSIAINNRFESTGAFRALALNRQQYAPDPLYAAHGSGIRVSNNILISDADGEAFGNQSNTDTNYYCDRNIYYTSGANLTSLGGVNQTSIPAIQAFYDDQTWPTNDENSVNTNPGDAEGILIDLDGDGIKEWVGTPQPIVADKQWRSSPGFRFV